MPDECHCTMQHKLNIHWFIITKCSYLISTYTFALQYHESWTMRATLTPKLSFVLNSSYYFHNGDCQEFVYRGCQKNENNFMSKSDRLKACFLVPL